jgi:capsular polysaccharide biosynthesis protein
MGDGDDRRVGHWNQKTGGRVPPQVIAPLPSQPAEQSGVLPTLRRRWKVVAIVAIACLAVVVPFAALDASTYTAKSRLVVGASGVPTRGAPDFLEAAEVLASTYSRAVTSEFVLAGVSRDTGLPKREIRARLSASPVPESPVFFIEATGPTKAAATYVASRATNHLLEWIRGLSQADRAGEALVDEISAAATAASRAEERESELRAAFETSATDANRRARERARAQQLAAEARLEGLRSVYAETRLARTLGHSVTILNPPTQAASDRGSKLQKMILAGLLGGLLAGCGVALLFDRLGRKAKVQPGLTPWAPTDVAGTSEAVPRSESEG